MLLFINMKKQILALLIIFSIFIPLLCYAEQNNFDDLEDKTPVPYWGDEKKDTKLIKRFPNGLVIDWEKGIAVARGNASVIPLEKIKDIPMPKRKEFRKEALKKSILAAVKKLEEVIMRIPIAGKSSLGDEIKKNKELDKNIKQLIRKSSRVLHRKIIVVDGKKRVFQTVVAFNLRGKDGLGKYLFPYLKSKCTPIKNIPVPEKFTYDKTHTGLIIDASGLGVEPDMSPKVYDINGNEIYGTIEASSEYVIENGIISYAKDLESAKQIGRAGNDPLIIKAISRGKDLLKSDVVISEKDGYIIRKSNEKTKYLEKCNVIIII